MRVCACVRLCVSVCVLAYNVMNMSCCSYIVIVYCSGKVYKMYSYVPVQPNTWTYILCLQCSSVIHTIQNIHFKIFHPKFFHLLIINKSFYEGILTLKYAITLLAYSQLLSNFRQYRCLCERNSCVCSYHIYP